MARFSDLRPIALRSSYAAATICFFSSGFLALVYEICWIRKAALVFGSASLAMSTVLGVFFAGLALGSYFSGRYARHTTRPLRTYALIELAVAILALASPIVFGVADDIFGWLYPFIFDHFWAVCLVRLALVALVLLPPSLLIGSTLPLICRALVRSADRVQHRVGLLYGVNTLGAAIGCGTSGFLLLPNWGADATLYYGGICNLAVAGVAWLTARRCGAIEQCDSGAAASSSGRNVDSTRVAARRALGVLFFLTGFVALGHEIVWARFLSLLMYNTVYTYTLTLTVILSGIVVGSILAATTWLQTSRPGALLGGLQAAIAVTVLGTLLLPLDYWQGWRNTDSVGWQLALIALIMLPSATLSGIAFPLAARLATRRADETAASVGWLAGVNTCGGLAGSLLIGFGALPAFGLHATVLMTTAASVIGGLVAWWWIDQQFFWRTKVNLSVTACGLWLLLPLTSGTRLPADFLAASNKLIEFREGLSSHLAVVRGEEGQFRLEIDRLWQGENRHTHQVVAAHLPMALHDNPRRVLVVGLGPGQTASRFLMYPIEQLDCVEIERELLSLLPKYFQGAWLKDRRVRCIVEDGRSFVWHTDERYDIISIEVGQAFRPGVVAFYTHDFYDRAKKKLGAGGLLTQFVSLEFFNCDELRGVIGTFAEAFPECALFHNRSELLLVGKRDGRLILSPERLQTLANNGAVQRDLNFSYWGAAANRLCIEPVFAANFLAAGPELRRFSAGARLVRDQDPWLEFSTSSHRTPAIELAITTLQEHLSPVRQIIEDRSEQEQQDVDAIRQQNINNLLSEDCIWQAQRHLQQAEISQAISLLHKALNWNADHVGARVLLSDALALEGNYSAASKELHSALARAPGLPLIVSRLTALAAVQADP